MLNSIFHKEVSELSAKVIKESSLLKVLFNIPEHKVNRYKFYKISRKLDANKSEFEAAKNLSSLDECRQMEMSSIS